MHRFLQNQNRLRAISRGLLLCLSLSNPSVSAVECATPQTLRNLVSQDGSYVVESPMVPLPSGGSPFDEKKIVQLFQRLPPEYREAYHFLVQELRTSHVDFATFRNALEASAKDFVAAQPELVKSGKFAAFVHTKVPNMMKSNHWTLELLMERKSVLGFPDRLNASTKVEALMDTLRKDGIRDVLIVDDASYSGTQLSTILSRISKNSDQPLNVHIVIPYMSGDAAEMAALYPRKNVSVKIYQQHTIPSFQSTVNAAVKNSTLSPGAAAQLQELFVLETAKSLTFFDHKAPDFMSAVTNRGDSGGTLMEGVLQPGPAAGKPISIIRPIRPPYAK